MNGRNTIKMSNNSICFVEKELPNKDKLIIQLNYILNNSKILSTITTFIVYANSTLVKDMCFIFKYDKKLTPEEGYDISIEHYNKIQDDVNINDWQWLRKQFDLWYSRPL